MKPEQEAEATAPCLVKFHTTIKYIDIPPECVYNSNQNILYYQNPPNILYVEPEQKKLYRGCKKIKDKMHITVMLCTSENGANCPLAIIRKSNHPKCLFLVTPPLPYKEQNNARFKHRIFKWWIHSVFWPCHGEYSRHCKVSVAH